MNDQSWFHQFADWIVGCLGALLLGLSAYINNRFKSHGKRLGRLERGYVRHEEILDTTLTHMREDMLRMHAENRESSQYIRKRVDALADRQAQ